MRVQVTEERRRDLLLPRDADWVHDAKTRRL
jgi:hypothetical protein